MLNIGRGFLNLWSSVRFRSGAPVKNPINTFFAYISYLQSVHQCVKSVFQFIGGIDFNVTMSGGI